MKVWCHLTTEHADSFVMSDIIDKCWMSWTKIDIFTSVLQQIWWEDIKMILYIVCTSTYLTLFTAMGDLIDFTLSNARQFHSSKGENLAAKGLKTIS